MAGGARAVGDRSSRAPAELPRGVQRGRQELLEALGRASGRAVDLVASLPEGAADQPAAGGGWTVADVAAHLVSIARRATEDHRRSATAQETATLNRQVLDEYGERRLGHVASDLRAAVAAMQERLGLAAQVLPADKLVPFHAGMRIPIEQAVGVAIGEFLVHGWDMAVPCGRQVDWPEGDVALVLRAMVPVLRGWTAPGAPPGAFAVGLGEGGAPLVFRFDADGLRIDTSTAGDLPTTGPLAPSEIMLALYGREPASDPVLQQITARLLPI